MSCITGLVYSNGYVPMITRSTTVHIPVIQCVKNHDAQYMLLDMPIICMPSLKRNSFSTTTDFMMITTLLMNASVPMMAKTPAAMIPPML